MIESHAVNNDFKWVDPDVLADTEETGRVHELDYLNERRFREFFDSADGWRGPKYARARERWENTGVSIDDPEPNNRLMAKVAAWSLAQLLEIRALSEVGEEK